MGYTSQTFQSRYYFLSGGPASAPTTVHAEYNAFFTGLLDGPNTIYNATDGATQINTGDVVTLESADGSLSVIYQGYYRDPNGMEDPLVSNPNIGEVAHGNYYANFLLGVRNIPYDYQVVAAPYDQGMACFVEGTCIRTTRGEVAVEKLVEGDLVVTASGTHRPIRWLGHRSIDCRRHPQPDDVNPIRIAAHALGEARPARDLYVSPGHAICIDMLGEILVPAVALVNGATIQQVEVDEITYWHVELDSHDVILAENQAAESYLDTGNRAFFTEADVVDLAARPDVDAGLGAEGGFLCRPYHRSGILVDAARARLHSLAEAQGWTISEDPLAAVHLLVDGERLEPRTRGLSVCFDLRPGARDIWLVSESARPCDTMGLADGRRLGLCLSSLTINDGFAQREVLSDPRLCVGFHGIEGEGDGQRRWTAGSAQIPASLWEANDAPTILRVDLAGPCIARWQAPVAGPHPSCAPAAHCRS